METSPNGSEAQSYIRDRAIELFEEINTFIKGEQQTLEFDTVTEPSRSEADEEGCDSDRVQQHLISSVVFRSTRHENEDKWEFENFQENMDIGEIDKIGLADNDSDNDNASDLGIYNDQSDLKVAMAENKNILLLRAIFDWSRPDANVWSQQIVWSGSLADSQRLVELMEADSPSIEVRTQHFDLHPHLRDQFISRHETHPIAAAISVLDSSPTVVISEEQVDEELLCSICHDAFSIGEPVKQLRCKHFYHEQCMFQWFYLRLQCPLCRHDFP